MSSTPKRTDGASTEFLVFYAGANAVLPTLDGAVDRIISLAKANDPRAVNLSIGAADAFLAWFRDPLGKKTWRDQLIDRLRKRGPKTPLMDQIIAAIDDGKMPNE